MSDTLLAEIRENRSYAETEWDEIRGEAKKDRLCVAGKPWEALDPAAVSERKETRRPYLALDELGQYINQTVNDVRANPRGGKFTPTGNGANDKGAEFYQNHNREIEYRSKATVADTTAFESAVTSSVGWLRVTTKREHVRTFNQDIWIEPVVNPDQVLCDPNAIWPDSRDMKFLYYVESWTKGQFEREFPKAKVKNFKGELRSIANQWLKGTNVDVAEYWKLDSFDRTLVAFKAPGSEETQISLVDELPDGKLPEGVENLREETVEDTRVKWWLTNGVEILRENKWKGKYIPFVSCYGKILYVDTGGGSRRQIMSMTRLARDPYMLYCYIRTCEAEAIGGVPRATWVGYEGQFAKPQQWAKANREPVAFLEAKANTENTSSASPLPLPRKEPWDPPLQNLEIAAEAARRAIQAAMGISPLPTAMQRQNQKSGRAMDKIESAQQRGSFHFVDHYDLMIERRTVIVEDLMDKILDTKRDVGVRKQDGSGEIITINNPEDPQSIFTKGDYRFTISIGPATDSQRESADDFVDTMVSNIGMIAQMAGPQKAVKLLAKSVKLKQLGPEGDEIVDLLDPPAPNGQDGKPIPPEVQQMQQQLQEVGQRLQQAEQTIQSDVHKEQAKIEGAVKLKAMDITFQREKVERDSETKLAVAELGAKVDRLTLFMEERARLGMQMHEATEGTKDRLHDVALAAMGHRTAQEQATQAHDQNLEAGAQGVAGQMAVAEQSAALQPEPDAGAAA